MGAFMTVVLLLGALGDKPKTDYPLHVKVLQTDGAHQEAAGRKK